MDHVYFAVLSRYFIQGVIVNVVSNSKRVDCHVLGLQRKKNAKLNNNDNNNNNNDNNNNIIIVIIIIIIVKNTIALLSLQRLMDAACSASLHLSGIYGHAVVARL